MMEKTRIEIYGYMELTYDTNSPEFKQALEEYSEVIQKDATAEDMLKHVAFHVNRFTHENMVEGVGWVGINGKKSKEDPNSGIMVDEDYDEFDFAIN